MNDHITYLTRGAGAARGGKIAYVEEHPLEDVPTLFRRRPKSRRAQAVPLHAADGTRSC